MKSNAKCSNARTNNGNVAPVGMGKIYGASAEA